MRASSSRAAQTTWFGAASRRRLSSRDLRELVRLTGALQVTNAPAFELYGVVVHLPANQLQVGQERGPGAQGAPGGAGSPQHADGGGSGTGRTARQQKRYERGQRLAQQRNEGRNSSSLESGAGPANSPESGGPPEEACGRRTASSAYAIAAAEAEATRLTADVTSAGTQIPSDMAAQVPSSEFDMDVSLHEPALRREPAGEG